jgi:hypothetical protein
MGQGRPCEAKEATVMMPIKFASRLTFFEMTNTFHLLSIYGLTFSVSISLWEKSLSFSAALRLRNLEDKSIIDFHQH